MRRYLADTYQERGAAHIFFLNSYHVLNFHKIIKYLWKKKTQNFVKIRDFLISIFLTEADVSNMGSIFFKSHSITWQ